MTEQWLQWIAENLLNGLEEQAIQQILYEQGFTDADMTGVFISIKENPVYRVAQKQESARKKLEWLLRVYHHIYNQSAYANSIERREQLGRDEFYEQYYCVNRPVILTGFAKQNSELVKRWTWDYLSERYGQHLIEFQCYQTIEGKVRYEKDTMGFSCFLARIQEADCPSDYYMTAYNASGNKALMNELTLELEHFPDYLNGANKHDISLWLGPKNTMGRLHMDMSNSVLTQVKGSKLVRLIPSFSLPYVYHDFATVSAVDLENWSETEFPLFKEVPVIETTLAEGEMLFIPIGWWHQIRSLEASLSLSFTNFWVDNSCFSIPEIYSYQ
jgi:hypothetical protein